MQSRLALYCDRLLEAGWLAALILTPLFFDPYTNRIFELDKVALLRSLALLMSAAWVVKALEAGGRDAIQSGGGAFRRWLLRNPLALPALLFAVVNILATVLSVAPWISLFGSYNRVQGLYTTLSYLVIFSVAASNLRARAQLERALDVIVFVSLPVALYGMIQHFGLDPLWGLKTSGRVTAQLGNSIFLAAYLIMVVPLTLARGLPKLQRFAKGTPLRSWAVWGAAALALLALLMAGSWRMEAFGLLVVVLLAGAFGISRRWGWGAELLPLVGYGIIFTVQLLTICFTQSRGPWLGLIGGLFAFVVLWGLVRGARRAVLTLNAAAAIIALAGLSVFLTAPSLLSQALKASPCVSRFGKVQEELEAGSFNIRNLIWNGAYQLVTPHRPIWSLLSGEDALNSIRPLLGYGPETMGLIYYQVQPLELSKARNYSGPRWDRAHNHIYDVWISSGLLGVVVYVWMLSALMYYALKLLGLIASGHDRNIFLGLWFGGGLGAALLLAWTLGVHFIGLAIPLGLLGGFFLYLLWKAARGPERSDSSQHDLWLIAIICGVIAHVIELWFGIALVATETYFWFYAALLVWFGARRALESEGEIEEASQESARTRSSFWVLISIFVLITLSFEFMGFGRNVMDAIIRSLFYLGEVPSLAIAFLLGLTWLVAGIIGEGKLTGKYATFSGVIIILYWGVHSAIMLAQGPPKGFIADYTIFVVVVFLLILALTVVLRRKTRVQGIPFVLQKTSALLASLLIVAVGGTAAITNVRMVYADIFYKGATLAYSARDWERAIEFVEGAISLRPHQDFYFSLAGLAYLGKAKGSAVEESRQQMFQAGERMFLVAQRLNPFDPEYAFQFSRLHWTWAQLSDEKDERVMHLKRAAQAIQAAMRLHPTDLSLYNILSQIYLALGDHERAYAVLQTALNLDSEYPKTHLYLGKYYVKMGQAELALGEYAAIVQQVPDHYEAWKAIALLSLRLGRYDEAEDALASTVELAPEDERAVYEALQKAASHQRAGELDRALQEAHQALQLAPDSDKPLIQAYISRLQQSTLDEDHQ